MTPNRRFRLDRSRSPLRPALVMTLLAALDGCTLIPAYTRPTLPVPAVYPTVADPAPAAQVPATTSGTPSVPTAQSASIAASIAAPVAAPVAAPDVRMAADIGWREFFVDVRLRALIALALDHNRDLRVAVLDIEQSRAQYRVQRSALLPEIDAGLSSENQRYPQGTSAFGYSGVIRDDSASLGFSSYEIDLFGRLRSLTAQARETLLATEEARRNVQISLVAEVATDFLTLAADRERLALAGETLRSQSESYELTRREAQIGSASDLALREAQTTVESARVDVARYTGQIAEDIDALNLVVGTSVPPELLPRGIGDALQALSPQIELPAGLPSDLLERRPDVLEAERTLRAANANIGAARAAFFPQITLTASEGSASSALSGLFAAGSNAWTFAPQVTLPIFAGGRNRANLAAAWAVRDIDLAKYEHAIQSAFRDVADGLALRTSLGRQLAAQQALVEASSESYRLSDARYRRGVDSYLNALDAQRTLYAAQQNLIGTQLSRMSNLVTLYQALGGGWLEQAPGNQVARAVD